MLRRGSFRSFLPLALVLTLAAAGLAAALSPNAAAAPDCSRFASTSGDDSASGTREAPFRTASRLMSSLNPGEVGCLLSGTYLESLTVRKGGSAGNPIRLQGAPGGRATIRGRLWVAESANDVVFSDLLLDGRNESLLPSPTVNGDRIEFYDNEVTNYHTASSCFILGHSVWGIARDVVLERNSIHDCGAIPVTNLHHGVYVSNARNARIVGNFIYDNADHGIQLYPDAQDTVIANNVLDGNGSALIFSGVDGVSSSGTRVTRNIITNSSVRFNVESWYPAGTPAGTDNLVQGNCIWNGKQGNVAPYAGYTVGGTVASDPLYANRAAKDFSLRPGSPCAGMGPPVSTSGAPAGSVPTPTRPPVPSLSPPSPAATSPGSPSGTQPPRPDKPAEPQRPTTRKTRSAPRPTRAKPLFARRGGRMHILWGGKYRTEAGLRRFVSTRGMSYAAWSRKHAVAARVLRTGRLPASRG